MSDPHYYYINDFGDLVPTSEGIAAMSAPAVHADVEQVTITVRVPEQFWDLTYDKIDWDLAVAGDRVYSLIEEDLDELELEEQVYGPDGQQVL